MTNPTNRPSLRRRLLRPSAVLMTLATAGSLVGLFASTAQAESGGNLTSAHAIAKHITPIKGTTRGAKGGGKGGGGSTNNGIFYHGGPVMNAATTNVYYIWYGDWSYDTQASSVLEHLAKNIGGSPWFNIETTYADGSNNAIKNSVTFVNSTTVGYTYGASLSDANIQSIVSDAISSGAVANDPNGVYFVLTSKDVAETSGFGSQYCGWHTYGSIAGNNIKYSFVGDPSQYMSGCAWQTTSPSGDAPADAMASVIAHELAEAASDPQLNAWYDHRGYENADKCAWTFGTTYSASNGSLANMSLGGEDYLIQRNWVNANGGLCALSY